MGTYKFGQSGVGGNLKYGVNGGTIKWVTDHFESTTTDGVTLAPLRVATTPVNGNDAASKTYVDGLSGSVTSVIVDTATDRIISNADLAGGIVIDRNNTSANTITINAGLTGTEAAIVVATGGGADTTFVAGAGVTLNSNGGSLVLGSDNRSAAIIPRGSDKFFIIGDLGTTVATTPYDVGFWYPAEAVALDQVMEMVIPRAIVFQDDFAGSFGFVETAPAATYTMSVERNGTAIGTISIGTTGAFTFATTGTTTEAFNVGDRLTVRAPATTDGTIDTITVTLAGTR